MKRTFALHAIGCRLNQYELEAVGAKLESLGFQQVAFSQPADLTVINTCSVTARADADGRSAVRRARRASPGGKVIVTGCYAQAEPDELLATGAVDLLVDNFDKDRLVARMVETFGYALPGGVDFDRLNSWDYALTRSAAHTRAMVKIQDGCQEACSYCIIPRARGRERSRPPEAVVREIRCLADNGYKEVVLTGVHVGKYRYLDLRLVDLLERICSGTGVERIRLSSLEPREFRPALLEFLARTPRICPHLHIPLQSGHDEVLRAMRRSYDTAYVARLFTRLAADRPDLALGSDLIAGFPGESEAHFEATVEFIRTLPLAYLHVFSYSDRPGTVASGLPGKIDAGLIRRRTRILRAESARLRRRFLDRHLGRTAAVLIERRREGPQRRLVGLTENYIRVLTPGPDHWMNEIVPLRLVSRQEECLLGEAA